MLYHPIYNNKNDSVTINIISCFKHNYEAEQLTTTEVNKLKQVTNYLLSTAGTCSSFRAACRFVRVQTSQTASVGPLSGLFFGENWFNSEQTPFLENKIK